MFCFKTGTMLTVIRLICVLILTSYKADAKCSESSSLPDLSRRSRTYIADGIRGSDPYVDDRYLFPGWYSVVQNGQQYLMPDMNSKPEFKQCGTMQPIYLKETHPSIDALTEQPQTVVACELYPFDPCLNKIDIDIRRCGQDVQYYLKGTSSNAAFCFDPPDLQNVKNFSSAPNLELGTLAVKSELRFNESNESLLPFLVFVCEETGGDNRDSLNLYYTTYWFIDDKLSFTFGSENSPSVLAENDLTSKNFSLGIMVRCGVKVAKDSTGLKTDLFRSENFFAGIKLSKKSVTISRQESKTVTFQPTIPYGCYGTKGTNQTSNCRTKVHMVVLKSDQCEVSDTNVGSGNILGYHNDYHGLCGFEIDGCYPHELPCTKSMQTFSMNITTRFLSNDDPNLYRLRLVVQDAMTHKIWKGHVLDEIVVFIKDDGDFKNKVCFSHVDPHMLTADGRSYDNNDKAGEFILYWNTKYNIVVQEKTTSCFSEENTRPFCTCAVAIRAGGDVFLVNLCNDLKFIGMTSCKDNGALVIRKHSEFDYQVETNIGTFIKIRIRPNSKYAELMNIDIIMAPKDYNAVNGLCGTFDNNKDNDFHDRSGNVLKDRSEFIDSWRITKTDTNYLEPTCKLNVKTWQQDGQQLFCSCDCYDDKRSSCKTLKSEALCSPSQYINCNVSLTKTDDLCKEFTHKCIPENRRKRSAFTIDPENEMKRKAVLGKTRRIIRRKRQLDTSNNLSIAHVKELCTQGVTKSSAVETYSNLLGGYNYSLILDHCIFDVSESQDTSWIESQEVILNDAVQIGFKRNANYTETHQNVLLEFKKQSCPSNCSGNGNCTEQGTCECKEAYYGPDCRHDIRNPPTIEDVEGGGLCDMRFGSECRCFEVQTDTLAETFYCQRISRTVDINGTTEVSGEATVTGSYKNFFTGECCFESHREKRSNAELIKVMHYEFDVSLSNDGINYGPEKTLYVYDSQCQEYFTNVNGNAAVLLKDNTCFIDKYCVKSNATAVNENCFKCLPSANRFNWTFDCTITSIEESDGSTLYIIIGSACAAVLLAVCFILIYVGIKKRRSVDRRETDVNEHINKAYSSNEDNEDNIEQTSDSVDNGRRLETCEHGQDSEEPLNYERIDSTKMQEHHSEYSELQQVPERNLNYEDLDTRRIMANESTYNKLSV